MSESTTSQNKASSDTQSPAPYPYPDPESIPTPDLYLIMEIIQYLAPAPDPGGGSSGVVAGSPFDLTSGQFNPAVKINHNISTGINFFTSANQVILNMFVIE